MVNNSINKNSNPKCLLCGNELILVSQEKVQPEGMRYAQTNTIYRCSNPECQKKKDKERADRVKLRENKEERERERIEKIQELRKLGKKPKQP